VEPFERLITQGMVLKRWVSVEKFLEFLGLSPEDSLEDLKVKISQIIDNNH